MTHTVEPVDLPRAEARADAEGARRRGVRAGSGAVTPRRSEPGPEQDLVARAAGGDQRAFRSLYDSSVDRVHGLLLRLNSNRALAEDLTQETFLRAWKGLPRFRGDSSFASWVHRIAVRVSIEAHRRRRLREERETDWPEVEAGVGSTRPAPTIARVSLERAIAELPDGAKTVFVLHEIEGFKHAEIAEMLGSANATIRSQLHRARKLLRKAIDR